MQRAREPVAILQYHRISLTNCIQFVTLELHFCLPIDQRDKLYLQKKCQEEKDLFARSYIWLFL